MTLREEHCGRKMKVKGIKKTASGTVLYVDIDKFLIT